MGRSHSLNNGSGLFRDKLLWLECKVSMLEHGVRKVAHSRDSLRVQVSEHGVGLPAADELDRVIINFGTQ
jgi:hypothetical protein